MKKNYIEWIDWLKGLGIILMLFSHGGVANATKTDVFINAFYMPLFFLISGCFLSADSTSAMFVVGKAKRLLHTYLLWGTLHFTIWVTMYKLEVIVSSETPLIMIKGLAWDNNNHFPIAGALWFLTCLFICSCFAFFTVKYCGRNIYLIVSVVIGIIAVYFHPFLPWSGDSALVANVFVAIGFCCKIWLKKFSERFANKDLKIQLAVVSVLMILFHFLAAVNGFTNIRECYYGSIPAMYFLCSLVGMVTYGMLAIIVYRSKKNILINPLAWIGRHSMSYVCLNQLCFAVLARKLPGNILGGIVQVLLTGVAIFIFDKMVELIDKKCNVSIERILFGK